MKRKDLLDAFDALNTAVSAKPIVEEMGCYRVDGKTLRASDGQSLVQAELPETTGLDLTVPAGNFYKLLKGLSAEDVSLELKDGKLVVCTDRAVARFPLASGPGVLDELDFGVEEWKPCPDALKLGVRSCRHSVSGNASRGVYCGVLVKDDSVLASDGIQISRFLAKEEMFPGSLVLPAGAAALLDRNHRDVDAWAVKNGTVYWRTGRAVYGAKLMEGAYTEKVWGFLERSSELGMKVALPADLVDILRVHNDQQADIPEQDRSVTVEIKGGELAVRSSDGVRYNLEMTAALAEAVGDMSFIVHPQCLLGILGTTREMLCGPDHNFVAFVDDGDLGEHRFLTTVQRPKA